MGVTATIGGFRGGRIALTHYGAGEVCRPHRHAEAQVSLVLAGDYREDGSAGPVFGQAGALSVKPAGFEHEDAFGDAGALILSIRMDPDALSTAYSLQRDVPERRAAMLACSRPDHVRALIGAGDGGGETGAVVPARPALQQAHARMAAGRHRSAEAARSAGLHPVTFARSFRSAFGRPPSTVRQQARLARAIEAVIRTDEALGAVALDAGFADQAHMTRQIARATGLPPGRLRRLFRAER